MKTDSVAGIKYGANFGSVMSANDTDSEITLCVQEIVTGKLKQLSSS